MVVECAWAGERLGRRRAQVVGGILGDRGCPSAMLPGLSRGQPLERSLLWCYPCMPDSCKMPIKTFDLNSDKSLFLVSS